MQSKSYLNSQNTVFEGSFNTLYLFRTYIFLIIFNLLLVVICKEEAIEKEVNRYTRAILHKQIYSVIYT